MSMAVATIKTIWMESKAKKMATAINNKEAKKLIPVNSR
jgi:hypothetical protein